MDSAGRALHKEVLPGEVSLRYSSVNTPEKERYRYDMRLLHGRCEWNRGALTEPISREDGKTTSTERERGNSRCVPRDLLSKPNDRKTPLSDQLVLISRLTNTTHPNDDPLTSSLTSHWPPAMATNGLDGPDKKSKQPANRLRRDQPLFGSRRPRRSLQQAPDFLTDSLNTSYIPSPSPPKSPTRQEIRARPRQAFGNGRSVAHSLKATPRSNDENKRPPGLTSSDRRNQQRLKPLPIPSRPNKVLPSTNPPAQSPARTQTPSPPRGRQSSVTSPVASESSPGRGYAEAYQRIVEEENLAQEESMEDMEEMSGFDFNEQDRSQDLDRMRLKRIQHSTSPISLKASRRASPRGAAEDSIAANDGAEDKENMVRDSDSESGTDYNAMVTDTSIGSGSSQYAKDLQRLGAIKEGAKIFSKARVGEKVALSVENLQRRNGSNESLGSAFSAGSLSQRGSDPSINIPKAWGRKAKPGKDWLNRINSKSGRFTGDVPRHRSSGETIVTENQEREWAEPIDNWIATASEVPLPSGEEGSSQTALSTRDSTPTTALQRSSSMDRRRQWEANEDEFTGRSLQVSESPPMRIRNATLDRYRDREIENLEKRAVTTNRLGELRERGSDELLRRRPPSRSTEELKKKGHGNTNESSPRRQSSSGSSVRSRLQELAEDNDPDATPDDTGEPIPDTPVVIYRSKSNDQSAVDAKGGVRQEDIQGTSQRPQHERNDSHDLLKRLARATSDSPSPAKEQEEQTRQGKEAEDRLLTSKSPSNVKTPVVTGAWVDQTMGDTPQASKSKADLKTPLVTGAWIDTPLPTGRGPPLPTPSNLEDEKELQVGKIGATDLIRKLSPSALPEGSKSQDKPPLKYSGPPLPKSALDGIIKQAKSTNPQKPTKSFNSDSEEDPTLHLGDSTIQSLEDLIANDTEIIPFPAPTPPVQEPNSSSDPSPSSQPDRSSTSTNPSRLTDLQSYTHLLTRLTNLAPSIRASKKQISSLQRAVSAPPPSTNNRRRKTPSQSLTEEPCNEAGEFHDFIWPCARCGCPGQTPQPLHPALLTIRNSLPDTTTLTIPIPRLWTWPASSWRPRLTWLGLFTLLAWLLVYLELWARDRFCHPLYASSMVGYGVDINAPRPPWVLAKVIYRYTALGTVLSPLYHFTRIVTRLLAALIGYIIGFIFGDNEASPNTGATAAAAATTRLPVSRDARIPKPVWGPDLSLMDDEYL